MSSTRPFFAKLATSVLAVALIAAPASGTCGGGGGGGMGGISSDAPTVYYVPWVLVSQGKAAPPGDLLVLWFPKSRLEAGTSPLRTSRALTLWSGQCVGVGFVLSDNTALREHFKVDPRNSVVVLSDKAGVEIERVEAEDGKLSVSAVEKMVHSELTQREDKLDEKLKQAKASAKAGKKDDAVALYAEVAQYSCLFPGQAKKAEKALRKLGHSVSELGTVGELALPDLRPRTSKRMEALMETGLAAERADRIAEARRLYERARRLDPADPVVLRFLGELHRHHTGDWTEARAIFRQALGMRSDRLTRAVALHGLGKMTIHAGEFKKGVELFEESIASFPLSLTYRNLAVYWNSEGESEKARGYVEKALELAPDEPYNQVFAATYLAAEGKASEATEIAERHHDLLAASYNLAAIYAQLGDRAKTLELLHRHFYEYERFDAVRAKEMQEARDDIVFARYHGDPEFVELTALAASNKESYHYRGSSAAGPAGGS